MSKVFVTGMGVISPIGTTVAENRSALVAGHSGISLLDKLSTRHKGVLPVGEIAIGNEKLEELLEVHEAGVTRTSLLALYALKEALRDAGISGTMLSEADTALVSANTVGGMCLMDELYTDVNRSSDGSAYLSSYDQASINLFLQAYYKIGGIVNTINTACSSSANAILYGTRLIKNGLARRVIAGGSDSLSKFTINGFHSLHILSPEICTPFDRDRKGLNLGEGAAFLILEREEDAAGKKIYAEVTGYGNSTDAFHPSSLSAEGAGPFLAMQKALVSARLDAGEIDFINAHGTGTENNDEVESVAMIRLFGKPPPFVSTKANIGHTLGASGAIEAVYSILGLVHQELYPGLHFKQPIPGTDLHPIKKYEKTALKHAMSNSFGFGGNCTSLIFSKA